MKPQKHDKKAIKTILTATGLYQAEFAEMINVSLDIVKNWASGRSAISPGFQSKILVSTGAQIQADGSVTTHWRVGSASGFSGKPFSKEAFDFWRKNVGMSDNATADTYVKRGAAALELVLRAATLPVRGKKNKLPAVWRSFEEWLVEVTEYSGLETQIEKIQLSEPKDFFWRYWRTPPQKSKR